jgi:predicted nucleic acid-binding protein
LYDPIIIRGYCLDTAAILISTAVLNSVSDVLMLVLPQQVIWELAMPMKRKLGLSAAFFVSLLPREVFFALD